MYVIIAECRVQPDHLDDFLAASRDDARGSVRDEPGCLRFDVLQETGDPTRVWLYEVYQDRAAFDHHLTTPHFHRWNELTRDWLSEPMRGATCAPVILTEAIRADAPRG